MATEYSNSSVLGDSGTAAFRTIPSQSISWSTYLSPFSAENARAGTGNYIYFTQATPAAFISQGWQCAFDVVTADALPTDSDGLIVDRIDFRGYYRQTYNAGDITMHWTLDGTTTSGYNWNPPYKATASESKFDNVSGTTGTSGASNDWGYTQAQYYNILDGTTKPLFWFVGGGASSGRIDVHYTELLYEAHLPGEPGAIFIGSSICC